MNAARNGGFGPGKGKRSVEKAKEDVDAFSKLALSSFDKLSSKNDFLRELIVSLVLRDK